MNAASKGIFPKPRKGNSKKNVKLNVDGDAQETNIQSSSLTVTTPPGRKTKPTAQSLLVDQDDIECRRLQHFDGADGKEDEALFEGFFEFESDSEDSEGLQEEQELMKILQSQGKDKATDLERVLMYVNEQRQNTTQGSSDMAVEEEARFGIFVDQKEYLLLKEELKEQRTIRQWFFFDMLFGGLVTTNGIILGLQTNETIDASDPVWKYIELGFVALFMFEFVIRLFRARSWRSALTDPWAVVDAFCLTVSIVDQILNAATSESSGLALISVMRVIRLMRLIRLVRLLALFNELWIMVSGLFQSIQVLFWSIMMILLFCYIFGVALFEALIDFPNALDTESARNNWGSVGRSVLSMAQIATYDGALLAKEYTEVMTHPILIFVFAIFTSMVSMSIMNLIVGVLLTGTLRSSTKEDGYSSITKRLLSHEAIRDLRLVLRNYCVQEKGAKLIRGSPLLSRVQAVRLSSETKQPREVMEEPHLTPGETENVAVDSTVLEAFDAADSNHVVRRNSHHGAYGEALAEGPNAKEIVQMQQRADDLEARLVKLNDERSFEEYFGCANVTENDIDEIYNAVQDVHGMNASISVDDFITSIICMKGKPHQLDMPEVMLTLRDIYRRTTRQLESVSAVDAQIDEASFAIREALARIEGGNALEERDAKVLGLPTEGVKTAVAQSADPDRADAVSGGAMTAQEQELLQKERDLSIERECWDRFDVLFGIIVLANALALGIEAMLDVSRTRDITNTKFDSVSFFWFIIEVTFLAIYITEFSLRAIFFYQMRVLKDYGTWLGRLPKKMWQLDVPTVIRIVRHLPELLQDKMFAFELGLITIATIDNCILRFITLDSVVLAYVRIFSLLRLLRVVRLVHLVKPLRLIASGFFMNSRLISWTFVLLLCLIYMSAIAMVDLIGKGSEDPTIAYYWGHLGDAMVTLALMATYNDWGKRADEVGKLHSWAVPFMALFTMIAGLGILNLVTGVMVQAAFNLVAQQSNENVALSLGNLRLELRRAVKRTYAELEKQYERKKDRVQEHIVMVLEEANLRKVAMESRKHGIAGPKSPTKKKGATPTDPEQLQPVVQEGDDLTREEWDVANKEASAAAAVVAISDDWSESGYNKDNTCFVAAALWITNSEVAIRYRTKADKSVGPMRDPALSVLRWEGGWRQADLCFSASSYVSTSSKNAIVDPLVEFAFNELDERDGVLVFGKVPGAKALRFRFGGNYHWVPVTPSSSEVTRRISRSQSEHELQVLRHTGVLARLQVFKSGFDPEYIGYKELEDVIQDRQLNATLEDVGLRAEILLLAFSELNVVGDDRMKVADFIDGVLRLKKQRVGIDVARSKSALRRMLAEMKDFESLSFACAATFAEAVEDLQGMKILADKAMAEFAIDADEAQTVINQLRGSQRGESHLNWLRDMRRKARASVKRQHGSNMGFMTSIHSADLSALVSVRRDQSSSSLLSTRDKQASCNRSPIDKLTSPRRSPKGKRINDSHAPQRSCTGKGEEDSKATATSSMTRREHGEGADEAGESGSGRLGAISDGRPGDGADLPQESLSPEEGFVRDDNHGDGGGGGGDAHLSPRQDGSSQDEDRNESDLDFVPTSASRDIDKAESLEEPTVKVQPLTEKALQRLPAAAHILGHSFVDDDLDMAVGQASLEEANEQLQMKANFMKEAVCKRIQKMGLPEEAMTRLISQGLLAYRCEEKDDLSVGSADEQWE